MDNIPHRYTYNINWGAIMTNITTSFTAFTLAFLLSGCSETLKITRGNIEELKASSPTQNALLERLEPLKAYLQVNGKVVPESANAWNDQCRNFGNPFAPETHGVVLSFAVQEADKVEQPADGAYIPFLSMDFAPGNEGKSCASNFGGMATPHFLYEGKPLKIYVRYHEIYKRDFKVKDIVTDALATASLVTPGATDKVLSLVSLGADAGLASIQRRLAEASNFKQTSLDPIELDLEMLKSKTIGKRFPIKATNSETNQSTVLVNGDVTVTVSRSLLAPPLTLDPVSMEPRKVDAVGAKDILDQQLNVDSKGKKALRNLFLTSTLQDYITATEPSKLINACRTSRDTLQALSLSVEDKYLIRYGLLSENERYTKGDMDFHVVEECSPDPMRQFLTRAKYAVQQPVALMPYFCDPKASEARGTCMQHLAAAIGTKNSRDEIGQFLAGYVSLTSSAFPNLPQLNNASRTQSEVVRHVAALPELLPQFHCVEAVQNSESHRALFVAANSNETPAALTEVIATFNSSNQINALRIMKVLNRQLTLNSYSESCKNAIAPRPAA